MKKVKIVVPQSQDDVTAQWLFEKEIRVLLSYSVSDFFDSKIVVICGVPDAVLADFQTHFKSNIK